MVFVAIISAGDDGTAAYIFFVSLRIKLIMKCTPHAKMMENRFSQDLLFKSQQKERKNEKDDSPCYFIEASILKTCSDKHIGADH